MNLVPIGEVSEVKSGFAFKSEDYLSEGIKLVRIGNLNGSSLNFNGDSVCVSNKVAAESKEYFLHEDDVLIAMSGATTGKVALVKSIDLPCLLNQRVGRFTVKKDKLDPKYLFYFLTDDKVKGRILKVSGGSAQPNVSPTQLKDFKIPLPGLKAQQEIAQVLEQADKARQQRKAANGLTDQFLQSSFLSLFGDPVKNEKGWMVKKIGEVCDKITDGEHLSPKLVTQGGYLIMAKDVRDNEVDFSQNNFVNNEDFEKFTRKCKPELGDLLLVSRGATIGRCCIVKTKTPFCLMGSVILLKPKRNSILSEYLRYLFTEKNFFEKVIKVSSASAQQAIYIANIKELFAPIPPLSLQQQFAGIVAQAEQLRQKQRESERELENLFQGLLQKYFG